MFIGATYTKDGENFYPAIFLEEFSFETPVWIGLFFSETTNPEDCLMVAISLAFLMNGEADRIAVGEDMKHTDLIKKFLSEGVWNPDFKKNSQKSMN